jgi:hypothetical protein
MRNKFWPTLVEAALIGLGASSMLLWLSYAFKSTVLFWPQAVGFWLCWMTLGIDNSSKADYWMTAMPLNAVLYAVLFIVVWTIFCKTHSHLRGAGDKSRLLIDPKGHYRLTDLLAVRTRWTPYAITV